MEERSMDESLKKASVLIEALPYIQRFNRKIIVVKYGGSAMVDDRLKRSVIEDVTLLKLVGFKLKKSPSEITFKSLSSRVREYQSSRDTLP